MVSGKNQNIVRIIPLNKRQVLIDGVGRSSIPVGTGTLLIGWKHKNAALLTIQIPRLAAADILVEHQRLILGKNAHSIDAGVDTVGKGKVDDAVFTAKGDCGFCSRFCQSVLPVLQGFWSGYKGGCPDRLPATLRSILFSSRKTLLLKTGVKPVFIIFCRPFFPRFSPPVSAAAFEALPE